MNWYVKFFLVVYAEGIFHAVKSLKLYVKYIKTEFLFQCKIFIFAKGRTSFVMAHRLSTIRNADKIEVIGDGSCIEYGTYAEVIMKTGAF